MEHAHVVRRASGFYATTGVPQLIGVLVYVLA